MKQAGAHKLAVIGGSGFDDFAELEDTQTIHPETPYGSAAPITLGRLRGEPVLFMPRHGPEHRVPPHRVNYRANLWALRDQGVQRVLAVNAVGGIGEEMAPGALVLPDQLIDYTHGREHTYFTGGDAGLLHTEFTQPYTTEWRNRILQATGRKFSIVDGGVYGCTQGPRLETAAEIRKLRNDGCDLVGMTGMPEAVLARELGLAYAALAVVVNRAAGVDAKSITLDTIYEQLRVSMDEVKHLIAALLAAMD